MRSSACMRYCVGTSNEVTNMHEVLCGNSDEVTKMPEVLCRTQMRSLTCLRFCVGLLIWSLTRTCGSLRAFHLCVSFHDDCALSDDL